MTDDAVLRNTVVTDSQHRRRRPRLDGFDYVGRHTYHLVTVTRRRQPFLVGTDGAMVVERLLESAAATAFDVLVYCVMPDHAHVLAQGVADGANAVRFIQRFKQATGHEFLRSHGERLWQQSFFDRALRKSEDAFAVGTYILENPVRAGFVERAEAWPLAGGSLVAAE